MMGWIHSHSLNSCYCINLDWFEVMQESRLMLLFRKNASPLGVTCVTSGNILRFNQGMSFQSVCNVHNVCCCRFIAHLGWVCTNMFFNAFQNDTYVL